MNPKFQIGQIVYSIVEPSDKGLVTGLLVRQGSVQYFVSWGNKEELVHYDFELSSERTYT